mmetsp:Transcript_106950/g.312774  ORF Transcript_106950/g.312774 Transcript_106950/m.312774 type:complete len:204 (-) Transcript_106950:1096-1707(-)
MLRRLFQKNCGCLSLLSFLSASLGACIDCRRCRTPGSGCAAGGGPSAPAPAPAGAASSMCSNIVLKLRTSRPATVPGAATDSGGTLASSCTLPAALTEVCTGCALPAPAVRLARPVELPQCDCVPLGYRSSSRNWRCSAHQRRCCRMSPLPPGASPRRCARSPGASCMEEDSASCAAESRLPALEPVEPRRPVEPRSMEEMRE